MQNAGQSCIAAKRFVVHVDVADRFVDELVARVENITIGDPRDPATALGPLATGAARDGLHRQVRASVAEGALVVTGGQPLDGPGFYYRPTVLTGVTPSMTVAREEVFGPVAAILVAADVDAMVRLANATPYGLAATVFGGDVDAAASLAARLDAGQEFVNGMVRSDPRFPFGGVKQSGYGRELGPEGLREFVNTKLVRVAA